MSSDLLNKIAQAAGTVHAAPATVERVQNLVKEAAQLEEQLRDMDEAYAGINGRFNRIKQHDLVEALKQFGQSEFKSLDGSVKVALKTFISGSLPKSEHDRDAAIEVITDKTGGSAIIKAAINLEFPKSQHNMALELLGFLVEKCKEMGLDAPEIVESVHAKTLQSFVGNLVKAAEITEEEIKKVGCFVGQTVDFTFFDTDGKKKKKRKERDDV